MNKQEAIEIVESRAFNIGDIDLACGLSYTKHIINQIDEPQKVVVPKFVAEWIKEARAKEYSLYGALDMVKKGNDVFGWLLQDTNQDTFAKAWIFGFDIEQEKLYTVEIPDPHGMYKIRYLFRNSVGNIRIGGNDYRDIFSTTEAKLTEAEIKEDFEWAWQWAKEVE